MRHRITRRSTLLGWTVAAIGALAVAAGCPPVAAAEAAVLTAPHAVAGSYLVTLRDAPSAQNVRGQAATLSARYAGTLTHTYSSALHGFATTMSARQARRLAADPAVSTVEQDSVVHALATQQNPPSYGLDRIDQRNLPLDNAYNYSTTASNVHAYIIDTGIRTTHQTFGGRATFGTNTTGDGNNTDCNGHGTHVAGTVGGSQYGVAKAVQLVAVKVLDCNGSGATSGVLAGIDWVTKNAVKPAVANLSLGSSANSTLDTAVRNSVGAGIGYAVASGGSATSACGFSPARVTEAITVNSSTATDARASSSNYGPCTDVFAPGEQITSAWNTGDTAANTISGTSMSAAHVTGAAALYLAKNPTAGPATVQTALKNAATPDKITNPGTGSPNLLLYTGS